MTDRSYTLLAQELLARFGYDVATHLSAIGQMRLWNVGEASDTAVKLDGPDGMQVTLWCGTASLGLADGKEDEISFNVSGEYPPDTFIMPKDKPKINVGYKRGAKAVAGDIERRFLSKYVPLYYEKLKTQKEIEKGRAARERVLADLAEWFGFKEVRDRDGHLIRVEVTYGDGKFNYRGKVNANYTTSLKPESERRWEVDLELKSLTIDQARRIAEALREPAFPPEQMRLL